MVAQGGKACLPMPPSCPEVPKMVFSSSLCNPNGKKSNTPKKIERERKTETKKGQVVYNMYFMNYFNYDQCLLN